MSSFGSGGADSENRASTLNLGDDENNHEKSTMKISRKNVPSTVDSAAWQFVDSLNKTEIQEFRDADACELHLSIRMAIRNNWNTFDSESPLWRDAFDHHAKMDADSISGLIMEKAQEILRGEAASDVKHPSTRASDIGG